MFETSLESLYIENGLEDFTDYEYEVVDDFTTGFEAAVDLAEAEQYGFQLFMIIDGINNTSMESSSGGNIFQRAWAAIKAFFKRIIAAIQKFFKTLFGNKGEKKTEDLVKRAKAILNKDDKALEDKYEKFKLDGAIFERAFNSLKESTMAMVEMHKAMGILYQFLADNEITESNMVEVSRRFQDVINKYSEDVVKISNKINSIFAKYEIDGYVSIEGAKSTTDTGMANDLIYGDTAPKKVKLTYKSILEEIVKYKYVDPSKEIKIFEKEIKKTSKICERAENTQKNAPDSIKKANAEMFALANKYMKYSSIHVSFTSKVKMIYNNELDIAETICSKFE